MTPGYDLLLDLDVPALPPESWLSKTALTRAGLAAEAARADPDPTEAQKASGNYKKGHVSWKGLPLTIETAKGQFRRGTSKDGKPWATEMHAHYGYVKNTESEADGDHVDVFLSEAHLDSEVVFVVNQVDPATGRFDEHKCVLGEISAAAAKARYLSCYEEGWKGFGSVAALTLDQFKWWLEHADTSKEVTGGHFAAPANLRRKKAAADGGGCHECPVCGGAEKQAADADGDNPYGMNCPECGGPAVGRCRCPVADAWCRRGHEWHRCREHGTAAPGRGHGREGCTCATKEASDATLAKLREAVAACTPEEMDGIYVYYYEPGALVVIDVMDWGDGAAGKRLAAAAGRCVGGDRVVTQNEGPSFKGAGWVRIDHPSEKEAAAYHFTGDVQGVHLRATLHKLLDRYKAKGLAYNDAATGDVYATLDADDATRAKILGDLAAYLKSNPRVRQFAAEPLERKERLRRVVLDDKKLHRMFARQGFTEYVGWEHDPAAYRRHWTQRRYRLDEDPATHALVGDVPEPAYRQLAGLDPVYRSQLTHPEAFGAQFRNRHAPLPPGAADAPPLDVPPAGADPVAKAASARRPPRLVLVKRAGRRKEAPFTVAVDFDGTLAQKQEPFDPETVGPPRADAVRWVRLFREAGARIIIFTVRGGEDVVAGWCEEHDVPYDYINENPDQPEGSSGKVLADVYWDDRAVDASDPSSGAEVLRRILEAGGDGRDDEGDDAGGRAVVIERTTVKVLLDPEDVLDAMEGDDA